MKVICDSSVLIGLAKIGKIQLLNQLLRSIYLPQAVFQEVVTEGRERPGVKEISSAKWIYKKVVKDRRNVEMLEAEL